MLARIRFDQALRVSCVALLANLAEIGKHLGREALGL